MKTRWWPETGIVSLVVVATGIGVLWTTAQMPVPGVFAKIGPQVFPYAVGAMMVALGLLLLRDSLLGRWACEANDPDTPPLHLVPLAWVGGGLIANMLLIKPLGFILASTVMYVLVAKGFGARKLWLAALCGFLLALAAYYGFAQLLGLRVGGGIIEDLI